MDLSPLRPSDQLGLNGEFCSVGRQMCCGTPLVAVFMRRAGVVLLLGVKTGPLER